MPNAEDAAIMFSLQWQSRLAHHEDRLLDPKIDVARDIFPGNLAQGIDALQTGEGYEESFAPGTLVPPFEPRRIIAFRESLFERQQGDQIIQPAVGRFYPQGVAWRALNSFRGNLIPFRLIRMDDGRWTADANHPLASYPLTLTATRVDVPDAFKTQSGACKDIAELVTQNGPGMQAPYPEMATEFYRTYPFKRSNEEDDRQFYQNPRLVHHLDVRAIQQVTAIYDRLLSSGSRILDLMSSWVSHLPDRLSDVEVTGLGLNEEELKTNPQLSRSVIHDLNQDPVLPFGNDTFDAVICTASIEYLIQPLEVMREVVRVTRPGGLFVTTFSDRWFPGKEILPWAAMHPFERQGLVLDYYDQTGAFDALHTASVRGWPRPKDDKYIKETAVSDPVFSVWGTVRG